MLWAYAEAIHIQRRCLVPNKEWWTQLTELKGERYALKRIKSDAAAMKREFDIPLETFAQLCHQPCHYCGRKNKNSLSIKSRGKLGGYVVKDFRYNGLDRVDNSIGYTEENVVPCCAVCNRAKNSMSYDEFVEFLDELVDFRTQGEENERHLYNTLPYFQWGNYSTGNATKITLTTSGHIYVSGNFGWSDDNGFPLWGIDTQDTSSEHQGYSQEEEPDEEEWLR